MIEKTIKTYKDGWFGEAPILGKLRFEYEPQIENVIQMWHFLVAVLVQRQLDVEICMFGVDLLVCCSYVN